MFCAQHIRNHVQVSQLKPEDRLFKFDSISAWRRVKAIGKKAGIDKPISPHKFRHARATDLVIRGRQETLIRKQLGWTGDSKMVARYQHVVDDDVINAAFGDDKAAPPKDLTPAKELVEKIRALNLNWKMQEPELKSLRARVTRLWKPKKS